MRSCGRAGYGSKVGEGSAFNLCERMIWERGNKGRRGVPVQTRQFFVADRWMLLVHHSIDLSSDPLEVIKRRAMFYKN